MLLLALFLPGTHPYPALADSAPAVADEGCTGDESTTAELDPQDTAQRPTTRAAPGSTPPPCAPRPSRSRRSDSCPPPPGRPRRIPRARRTSCAPWSCAADGTGRHPPSQFASSDRLNE
ncbi:hypothetical protein GCM10009601_60990 [Streptomyces thermospinosisporus]|uniref:Secreted protein n=1 Tax=Streptomyces thermospinosisporus TaxID=161482 RepID=A0ABP4JY75_9ACTN